MKLEAVRAQPPGHGGRRSGGSGGAQDLPVLLLRPPRRPRRSRPHSQQPLQAALSPKVASQAPLIRFLPERISSSSVPLWPPVLAGGCRSITLSLDAKP